MKVKEIITQSLAKKSSAIVGMILAMIVVVVCEIFGILIIRNLVDDVFEKNIAENPGLALRVTAFCLTALTWFFLNLVVKDRSTTIGSYVGTELEKAIYSSGMRAELSEVNRVDKEEIINHLTDDCKRIGNEYIAKTWLGFFKNLFFLIGIFIMMIIINPTLGLITYVALPVFFMATKTFNKYSEKLIQKAEEEISSHKQRLVENFTKVKSIKLKNGTRYEEEIFQKNKEREISLKRRIAGLEEINERMIFFLFVGGVMALVMGIGGYLSTREQTITGTIVAFIILIPFVYNSFQVLLSLNISPQNIGVEIESLNKLLSLRSEIRSEPISSLEAITSLKFENVSYYSSEGNLEAINFEVKTGEKLGILTLDSISSNLLFELLTKLIRPKEGNITINNCDINKLNTFYLRDIVTAIPQERYLFNDTIANNITYPLEFDEYKYNDALNRSGLKDILNEYEDRDQTILKEDDPKTREMIELITLANAFYKDSKIFVLNDATSGLDARSEDAILKEIFKLKNKMIILMSNKTYNVVNCDKILIIENEQVLEYGKVSELLQDRNSAFSKLIKKVKVGKIKVS